MDECRKRLRKVGRKGVRGSSSDFYFASLDGNLVLDAGERKFTGVITQKLRCGLLVAKSSFVSWGKVLIYPPYACCGAKKRVR